MCYSRYKTWSCTYRYLPFPSSSGPYSSIPSFNYFLFFYHPSQPPASVAKICHLSRYASHYPIHLSPHTSPTKIGPLHLHLHPHVSLTLRRLASRTLLNLVYLTDMFSLLGRSYTSQQGTSGSRPPADSSRATRRGGRGPLVPLPGWAFLGLSQKNKKPYQSR